LILNTEIHVFSNKLKYSNFSSSFMYHSKSPPEENIHEQHLAKT